MQRVTNAEIVRSDGLRIPKGQPVRPAGYRGSDGRQVYLVRGAAQHRGCPVKIVLQGGKVFRGVQPTLDWCSGCTPDNCPGGCNRTAPEVVADER